MNRFCTYYQIFHYPFLRPKKLNSSPNNLVGTSDYLKRGVLMCKNTKIVCGNQTITKNHVKSYEKRRKLGMSY